LPRPDPSFPAPIYADTVLAVNFRDAQTLFLDHLIQIHYAHTLMLARQNIIPIAVAKACLAGLDELDVPGIRTAPYDGSTEDLFFYVERELERTAGPENAGWMHTARSRNDIDSTLYRQRLRLEILHIVEHLNTTRDALLQLAQQHLRTLMPAYTHTQPAQPITFGHYLAGAAELLARDANRLQAAFTTVNRCPLGACAIATTGFPIDRDYTAKLLGFDGLQLNSYGAIAATDYLTETAGAIATTMINLGRIAQDFLLWCTAEFGYLRLSDAWVQISSIMPQKRNPVPFEHVRALASKSLGQTQGIFLGLHNTPWGDTNDAEDDLQPVVAGATLDAKRALRVFGAVLLDCEVNTVRMAERAHADFLTVTELADTLVRREGISFREAHGFVSATVKELKGNSDPAAIASMLLTVLGDRISNTSRQDLLQALDPAVFVQIRSVPGGPAAEALEPAIAELNTELRNSVTWLESSWKLINDGPARIREQRERLVQRAAQSVLQDRGSKNKAGETTLWS